MYFFDQFFRATLTTEENGLLAEGCAQTLMEDRAVEFRSDFVPLLLMGTKAQVHRIANEEEIMCFEGEVYLSSPQLLRIVNVDEKLLAEVELEKLQELSFMAKAKLISSTETPRKHLPSKMEVEVSAISLTLLRFTSSEELHIGDRLEISSITPMMLNGVIAEVKEQILFGTDKTGYRCDILTLPQDSRQELITYLSSRQTIEEVTGTFHWK